MSPVDTPNGAQIAARGFQPYEGERSGVPGAIRSVTWQAIRSTLGLGRPAGAREMSREQSAGVDALGALRIERSRGHVEELAVHALGFVVLALFQERAS